MTIYECNADAKNTCHIYPSQFQIHTATNGTTTITISFTSSVTIGGVAATNIPYFGNAPGFLESVLQINVVIPAGVPSSPYDQLNISAGGATSPLWTTIAVQ